jgi:hypothetical protein
MWDSDDLAALLSHTSLFCLFVKHWILVLESMRKHAEAFYGKEDQWASQEHFT